jgi:dienelactone hydrolase
MVAECCMKGFKWEGTPVGTEGTLGKNRAYITGTNAEVAVLLIHDIYGWKLQNIRLLADHFAQEADCTVYVADLYALFL